MGMNLSSKFDVLVMVGMMVVILSISLTVLIDSDVIGQITMISGILDKFEIGTGVATASN